MKQVMSVLLACAVAGCLGATVGFAQKPIEKAGNVSKSATITAIDHTARVVTLKDDQGQLEDIYCGPEIKRFGELKVGDTVTFTYHAAVVFKLLKPGESGPGSSDAASTVAGKGVKPSGAMTRHQTSTVTIEAIDSAAPSVTVQTPDGHVMTAEVKDRKNLEGVKVGDKVSITFTEAVMVVVEPPKK